MEIVTTTGKSSEGRYIKPRLEDMIIRALGMYSHNPELTQEDRELCASYSYALQNDTWLLETGESPGGGRGED